MRMKHKTRHKSKWSMPEGQFASIDFSIKNAAMMFTNLILITNFPTFLKNNGLIFKVSKTGMPFWSTQSTRAMWESIGTPNSINKKDLAKTLLWPANKLAKTPFRNSTHTRTTSLCPRISSSLLLGPHAFISNLKFTDLKTHRCDFPLADWNKICGKCFSYTLLGTWEWIVWPVAGSVFCCICHYQPVNFFSWI